MKDTLNKTYPVALVLLFGLALTACGAINQPEITPSATPLASDSPVPSFTPTQSSTSTRLPSPTSSPAPSSTPTPTPTATPPPAPEDISLFASGPLSGYRYFFSLTASEPVEGDYYAVVDEDEIYTCNVLQQYPNRLYCSGRQIGIRRTVPFEVFESESGVLILRGEIFLSALLP